MEEFQNEFKAKQKRKESLYLLVYNWKCERKLLTFLLYPWLYLSLRGLHVLRQNKISSFCPHLGHRLGLLFVQLLVDLRTVKFHI